MEDFQNELVYSKIVLKVVLKVQTNLWFTSMLNLLKIYTLIGKRKGKNQFDRKN